MASISASLAWLHVIPASPYVVFPADWLLLLSKLDLAIVWYADLAFRLAGAFPLKLLPSESLLIGFAGPPVALDWGFGVVGLMLGKAWA